jgi:hypothetical protein
MAREAMLRHPTEGVKAGGGDIACFDACRTNNSTKWLSGVPLQSTA